MSLHTSRLPLLTYRMCMRFEHAIPDPAGAGEMWRGALKAALKSLAPEALLALCEPETVARMRGDDAVPTNQLTPGFALRIDQPAADGAAMVHEQYLVLTFFGQAGGHAQAVLYALMDSAQTGVGTRKLPFTMTRLECWAPLRGWREAGVPLCPEAYRDSQWVPGDGQAEPDPEPSTSGAERVVLALMFSTRLVLEVRDVRIADAPPLQALVDALMMRANRLGEVWGDGPLIDDAAQDRLRAAAGRALLLETGTVRLGRHSMHSSRQRAVYPSSGPQGLFVYALPKGAAATLIPLLDLGQWLHVGTQTTAGLGHYRLLTQHR